jgi:hypothetical protein
VTFLRLSPGHVVAAVAALALLAIMAVDWYSTAQGESFRRDESLIEEDELEPGTQAFDTQQQLSEDASIQAEEEEQNAWTASDALDRAALVLLLASIVLALAAAALRAAGRRYPPPLTPSVAAAVAAGLAALLVAVRIVDVGSGEAGGAIEAGAPLGLVALAALALGSLLASRVERDPERPPQRQPA